MVRISRFGIGRERERGGGVSQITLCVFYPGFFKQKLNVMDKTRRSNNMNTLFPRLSYRVPVPCWVLPCISLTHRVSKLWAVPGSNS